MFLIVSKLPQDFYDVMRILPFWYTYLYYFLWVGGIALVLILLIYLGSKLVSFIQSRPPKKFESQYSQDRRFSKVELRRDLRIIMENTKKNEEFRGGLHRMSSVLKTYFEILLKIDIEEMTAKEIKTHVKEKKDLGVFFTELTVSQYALEEPDQEKFISHYNKALKLIR